MPGNPRTIDFSAIVSPLAVLDIDVTIHAHVTIYPGVRIGRGVTVYDGAVIGRPPQRAGGKPVLNLITTIGAFTVIGAGATIYAGTDIGVRVLIGDGARIRENCYIEEDCIVGSNCTFQNSVSMFRGSRVIDLSHITANVVIDEDAFVSTGVLTMNDNAFNGNTEGDGTLRAPSIGKRASVGGGAILLPGVNVGEAAVVAAGAVVTKDVAERTTVMGIPAKRYE